MAIITKHKDTTGAAAGALEVGELGVNTVDGTLSVGTAGGNTVLVSGEPDLPTGTDGQTLRNNSGAWESTSDLVVDSSGNVGIGGSAVTNRRLAISSDVVGLQMLVQTTSAESGIAFNDSGSTNTFGTRLGSKADDLTFTTSGAERMRIDSAGAVTIGDGNSPGARVPGTTNGLSVDRIHTIVTVTQAQYDNLTPDTNSLYIIV